MHFLYAGRSLKGSRVLTAIIYPPNIPAFVEENNRQILTNFSSVLFNTQVKVLKDDGHICTFINFMLASLIQHNEALKGLAVETNIISVVLFSSADVLSIISDTLKTWGRQFKEQHERMNKISS